MFYKKRFKGGIAFFLSCVLAFTPLVTFAAEIDGKSNAESISDLKIKSEVKEALEDNDFVDVLVELNEQVNTTKVSKVAMESVKGNKTPYSKKMAARYAVVDSLKDTAEDSQKNVLDFLELEKKTGNVENYKGFFIINVIHVKAKGKIIKKLSYFKEVKAIHIDEKFEVEYPDTPKSKETHKVNKEKQTKVDVISSASKHDEKTVSWGIEKIEAQKVWKNYGVDGTGVVVGIIDSGVYWQHEALKTKWRGYNPAEPDKPNPVGNWYDAVSGEKLPYDSKDVPHGTHVTGTVLGQDSEGKNVIGVAPGAKWIAAKALGDKSGQLSWMLDAGQWMLAPNGDPSLAPDIINNSWSEGPGKSEWFRGIVQKWRDAGILPVFAAGNTHGGSVPGSVCNPANYPECFAVAATDINDKRGDFSNQGPGPYDEVKPDISAPGVKVRSSVPGGYQDDGWNGTSMAAPHVTGIGALLLSVDAGLTPDNLEKIMIDTCTPLTDNQYSNTPNYGYGVGLVNAFNAVSSISAGVGKIKGRVVTEGIDKMAPVIIHEGYTSTFKGSDMLIEAKVKDDIAIVKSEIWIKNQDGNDWVVVPMSKVSGDHKEAEFSGIIPHMFIKDPGFKYVIKAYDYSSNIGKTQEFNVNTSFGIKPDSYISNFSKYPLGWSLNGDWQWGTPVKDEPKPLFGEKLIGTNLKGAYSNNPSTMVMPPLDLRSSKEATLVLNHWYETEPLGDFCIISVSNDLGQTWKKVKEYKGFGKNWEEVSIDLKEYCGEKNPVLVSFTLSPDESLGFGGWFIDNVRLLSKYEAANNRVSITKNDEALMKVDSTKKVRKLNEKDLKFKINKLSSEYEYSIVKTGSEESKSVLPIDASVTVLETGRTVKTNPIDGTFMLNHPAVKEGKKWTLSIEAYGFKPYTEEFTIADKQEYTKNFFMKAIPKSTIAGNVIDERTGEIIKGAKVKLLEDVRVLSSISNENGKYELNNILEGDYTLRITAPNYIRQDVKVNIKGGKTENLNIKLKPFIGFENEISYDDGKAESTRAAGAKGDGHAVKITPKSYGMVKGVKAFLSKDFPNPGSDEFYVGIFDSKENGDPGEMIFKTDVIKGIRGEWTYVDLTKYGFSTERDFYLAILQVKGSPNCPGIALDENEPHSERSYKYEEGKFTSIRHDGNFLIRASMLYSLDVPVITNINDGMHINKNKILISGIINSESSVDILVNAESQGVAQTKDNKFEKEILLQEGKNIITVKGTAGYGKTDSSLPITVVKDTKLPILEVTSPKEGEKSGKQVYEVLGKVIEENLENVYINNEAVKVNKDGSFNSRVIMKSGQNLITILAKDLAGNICEANRTINTSLSSPVISNVKPNADIYVKEKEVFKVSFDSTVIGGEAYFNIIIPNNASVSIENLGIKMVETLPGHYEGNYIVPENTKFNGAGIEITHLDLLGNRTTKISSGKIYTVEKTQYNSLPLKISELKVHKILNSILVEGNIENLQNQTQSPMFIVSVNDSLNRTISISTIKASELLGGDSIKLSLGFGNLKKGEYKVKVFVWDDLVQMNPLSKSGSTTFVVD